MCSLVVMSHLFFCVFLLHPLLAKGVDCVGFPFCCPWLSLFAELPYPSLLHKYGASVTWGLLLFAFTGILLLTFSRPLEVFRAYISSFDSLGLLFAFCAYRSLFLVHATCMVFMFVFLFIAWFISSKLGCSFLLDCCQFAADVCMWCLAWTVLFGWIGCFAQRRLTDGIPFTSRWIYHGVSWACCQFFFVMLMQCPCLFL